MSMVKPTGIPGATYKRHIRYIRTTLNILKKDQLLIVYMGGNDVRDSVAGDGDPHRALLELRNYILQSKGWITLITPPPSPCYKSTARGSVKFSTKGKRNKQNSWCEETPCIHEHLLNEARETSKGYALRPGTNGASRGFCLMKRSELV